MKTVRNVILLAFVRLPAALIILLAIFVGQCLIRLGHGCVRGAEALARFLDTYCPIRFEWSENYWARQKVLAREERLSGLNQLNRVEGGLD